jgi:hypothetical protein
VKVKEREREIESKILVKSSKLRYKAITNDGRGED